MSIFTDGKQKDIDDNEVRKHLQLHDLGMGEYQDDQLKCLNPILPGLLNTLRTWLGVYFITLLIRLFFTLEA